MNAELKSRYEAIKAKHPDAILVFRAESASVYEVYGDDAYIAIEIVKGVKLDPNEVEVECYKFAFAELDNVLHKLVGAGKRVGICEDLEDPKKSKKLVKRGL